MQNVLLKPKKSKFLIFLTPGIVIYVFSVILPVINAIRFSFFKWSGGPVKEFVGFSQYIKLVNDELFFDSFFNNLEIIVYCMIGQIGIALVIAAFLDSKIARFIRFHRTVIFFPVVMSAVVIGFIWTMMYNKDYGLINGFLRGVGLESLIKPWLDRPEYVMVSVSVPIIWQYIGYYMVIIMSGMSNIPREVLEVASIDGATGWKKVIYIILPLIKNTLVVCVMLCIAGNMKIFDHIFVMTAGGPGNSSSVMSMYAYKTSFNMYKLGYGSCVSVGILILSLTIILISRKLMGGGVQDD